MKISALDVFITAEEVASHIQKLLAKIPVVQNATVECADNGIIIRGNATLGLTVPFETLWHVTARATNEVVVELARLKASVFGLGGDAMAEMLMNQLSKKLEHITGVRVEGRTIRADAVAVLKQYDVELRGVLREITVTREGVSIKVD